MFLLLSINLVFVTQTFGQRIDSFISQEIKMILFSSVETDGAYIYNMNFDKMNSVLSNHYEFLEIKMSSQEEFIKPRAADSISGRYLVRLYKIINYDSGRMSRYLLHYIDFNNNVWLRVGGYVENDLKVFFDYLISQGISRKQLKGILERWEESDSIYKELDLACKLNGYFKNSTNSDCFYSVFFITKNKVSLNGNRVSEKSCFSRCPLSGMLYIR